LHAPVIVLDKSKATLKFAQPEFDSAVQLLPDATVNREEYDRRQAALSVGHVEAIQSASDVHQSRVSLGLVARPESRELGEVPADIDQTFSSLGVAQAALIQTAGELGVAHAHEQLPKEMLKQLFK
jgi:membrane fusion protein, multidrug efflux system